MREELSKYSHISVREAEAADLLDSIGVHGAVPVIDPTLMLTQDDWAELHSRRCAERAVHSDLPA